MKRYNIIQEKSYAFALEVLRTAKSLRAESADRVLINQFVRSGTSIGANVEEAIGAQSDRDFLHKISISYKEARETKYWISLMRDIEDIGESKSETLLEKCEELLRILDSIQLKLRSRNS